MAQSVERLILLKEMGEGLLCSLYLTMSRLQVSSLNRPTEQVCSTFVRDARYTALRNRIGNAFPKVADLRGVEGQVDFERSAGTVIRFFARFKMLVHDLVDFTEAVLPVLLAFPQNLSVMSLETNRSTCLLYVDLCCTYLRVLMLLSTCHEAKTMYALNAAAEKVYRQSSQDEPDAPPPSSPPTSPAASRRATIASPTASTIPLDEIHTPEDLTYLPRAALLFRSVFDGLHTFLLASFAPLRPTLSSLLAQMGPGLALARALQSNQAPAQLAFLLEPLRMGAAMSQPDCPKVPTLDAFPHSVGGTSSSGSAGISSGGGSTTLGAYAELAEYERYTDAAILIALACPSVLFDGPARDVVAAAAREVLVVRLFRDVGVSVHVEIEAMVTLLVPSGMSGDEKRKLGKPKGLKLKDEAKAWARHAVKHCPANQRAVRCHLAAQLGSLNTLLALCPALLGPRLPQVLAIASLAKAAALCYFRHANNDRLKMRRDCKPSRRENGRAALRGHLYEFGAYTEHPYEATELVSALLDLVGLLQRHKDVAISYYAAFCGTSDAEAVSRLCAKMAKEGLILPGLMPIVDTFSSSLSMATSAAAAARPSLHDPPPPTRGDKRTSHAAGGSGGVFAAVGGSVSRESIIFGHRSSQAIMRELSADQLAGAAAGSSSGAGLDLYPLRLNWERCLLALSTKAMQTYAAFPLVAELSRKMALVCARTRYVDDLERLVTQFCEPFELCWFQNPVQHAFMTALQDTRCVDAPAHALCYLLVPLLMRRNVHVDCPAEDALVGRDSVRFLDELLSALGDHVVQGFKGMWNQMQLLEAKRMALEAARRVERIYADRSRGLFDHTPEAIPGSESEPQRGAEIEQLVCVRSNLSAVVTAVAKLGHLVCFDREYSVDSFVRQRIVGYLEQRLHGLFLHVEQREEEALSTREENLQPLAVGLTKLVTGLHAAMSLLALLDDPLSAGGLGGGGGGGSARTHGAIQMLLFRECSDVLLPPPGAVLSPLVPPSSDALIWRIALWFSGLAEQAVSSAGVVCVPTLRAFGHLVARQPHSEGHGGGGGDDGGGEGDAATGAGRGFELFLTSDELRALCVLCGPQGARVIESQLLRCVCFRLKTGVLPFLFENRAELLSLVSAPHESVAAVLRLTGLDELHGHLITIGFALALRLALLQALGEAVGQQAPTLAGVLAAAAGTVHLTGNRALAAPLYSLCDAAGRPSASGSVCNDAALCAALEEAISGEVEEEVFALFPVACAAVFAAPAWARSSYLPEHDVYEDNAHLMPLAVSTLVCAFFGRDAELPSYAFDRAAQQERVDHPRRLQAHICSDYLYISAQVLLTMRMAEGGFEDRPLAAMALLLQAFCGLCPAADATMLQRVFPFALMHHGDVGTSLGWVADEAGEQREGSFVHVRERAGVTVTV